MTGKRFDNKRKMGIIQNTKSRLTADAARSGGVFILLRFTSLYTFPPLYTQKPAARRVFVFFTSYSQKDLPASNSREVFFSSCSGGLVRIPGKDFA